MDNQQCNLLEKKDKKLDYKKNDLYVLLFKDYIG